MTADALHRFIDARAVRLPADLGAAQPSLREPLAERLAGHDVVALGEMNHLLLFFPPAAEDRPHV